MSEPAKQAYPCGRWTAPAAEPHVVKQPEAIPAALPQAQIYGQQVTDAQLWSKVHQVRMLHQCVDVDSEAGTVVCTTLDGEFLLRARRLPADTVPGEQMWQATWNRKFYPRPGDSSMLKAVANAGKEGA
jgi:hypothetical protein